MNCMLAPTSQPDRVSLTMKIKFSAFALLLIAASTLSSCVPLAVGAAAGYVAHEEGYRVRNPITKTGD